MNEISLLSQDTIDKIAAGEVVERPASIVKELVENAVDAGASAVTVEIKDGGTSLVRITDNGCGIPKGQVRTAFLRHATSKIRRVEDLLTAGTLGFRGEALSSIAAVSQVEMVTKTAGSLTGVRYVIEGGAEKSLEEIGAPEGTTFLVRNLFYNTPARKKFLKTAATEAGYVSDLLERMALSHPGISFKFITNRETKLHTSGNCRLKDIVYGVYGREIAGNLIKVEADYGFLKIHGMIGKPVISRGNRNYENYFVNGRYVKSAIVARAIEDGYKAFLMNHRYPFTALMLEIDTDKVDVNVHPTKMEVRFADQQKIYECVLQTVKEGLLERELIPEITLDAPAHRPGKQRAAEPEKARREPAEPEKYRREPAQPEKYRRESAGPEKYRRESAEPETYRRESAEPERPAGQRSFAPGGIGSGVSRTGGTQDIHMPGGAGTAAGSGSAGDAARYGGSAGGNLSAGSGAGYGSARPRYPEPFEKHRSQLIAEADSPYSVRYDPAEHPTVRMKPVTGSVLERGGDLYPGRDAAEQGRLSETTDSGSERNRSFGTARGGREMERISEASGSSLENDRYGISGVSCGNEEKSPEPSNGRFSEEMPGGVPRTTVQGSWEMPERSTGNPAISGKGSAGISNQMLPGADAAVLAAVREDAARIREEEALLRQKAEQMDLFGDKLLEEGSRPRHKLIGQVFATYWLVEFEDKLYIIDQHAAHEKVMYERFMKNYREKRQTSQRISPPLVVSLSLQEEELLKHHLDAFESVGFEVEPFGGREYAISAVPDNLYGLASRDLFLEILDGLSDVSERASDDFICEKIASMSCKAAVKGGNRLSPAEADALIGELLTLENPYNCPHGRPTIISMTKYELEKKFKRVV